MSDRRTAALVLAGAVVLAATLNTSAGAAPNPYGDSSSLAELQLSPDGSYAVELTQRRELMRDWELSFGGSVHDGFRLPDVEDQELPPYLRADYALESFVIDGQTVLVEQRQIGHRVEMIGPRRSFPEGVHTALIGYTVSGAAIEDEGGYTVYLRNFDSGGQVRIAAPEGAEITGVECFTIPPDSVPCGAAEPTGWFVDEQPATEGILAIRVDGPTDELAEPEIDGG